jgi:hypothetical protein
MALTVKRDFTIQNFLSEVRTKGLARPIHFEVNFGQPTCVKKYAQEISRVSLMCKNASLPMTRIITSRMQFAGAPTYRPIGVDYGGDNLTLTFYVDSQMRVKAFFDEWVDGIVNRETGNLYDSKNYLSNLNVKQLNSQGFVEYYASFEDIYPVAVNPLILDHGSTGQVHELAVTFNYRRWRYDLSESSLQPDGKSLVPESQTNKPPSDGGAGDNKGKRKRNRGNRRGNSINRNVVRSA